MNQPILQAILNAVSQKVANAKVYTVDDLIAYCEKLIIDADGLFLEVLIDPAAINRLELSHNPKEAVEIFINELFSIQAPHPVVSPVKQLH